MITCSGGHDLLDAEPEPVCEQHVLADRYLLGRLGVIEPLALPILDEVNFEAAAVTLNKLGTSVILGPTYLYGAGDRTAECMSEGVRLLSDWPRRFESYIAEIVGAEDAKHRWARDVLCNVFHFVLSAPDRDLGEKMERVMFQEIFRHPVNVERAYEIKWDGGRTR
ncbi:hypothetical protein [Azorhizobium oxalatiphilum]|nr:hypothetical protein [Azorhizobium oxalatiphilum]